MVTKFELGKSVIWNFETSHVSGKIIKVHSRDADYQGYMSQAQIADDEVKSDKAEHIAVHEGAASKSATR